MHTFAAWSLGRKLGIGFGLTAAIFLVALVVTLLFAASAQSRFEGTARWDTAVEGFSMQPGRARSPPSWRRGRRA